MTGDVSKVTPTSLPPCWCNETPGPVPGGDFTRKLFTDFNSVAVFVVTSLHSRDDDEDFFLARVTTDFITVSA